jgi:glutamyl-tRNA synthetase
VRLGWSHGDQEIFSLDELIELFDIDQVNKAASTFNTDKLLWLNQHYVQHADPQRIAHLLSPHMGRLGIDPSEGAELKAVVAAQQARAKTLVELAQISAFVYQDFDAYDEASARKHLRPVAVPALERAREALELLALEDWEAETLERSLEQVALGLGEKMGKVAQPLRVAVVGRAASPGIGVTLELVGKEATLRRIDQALDYISSLGAEA